MTTPLTGTVAAEVRAQIARRGNLSRSEVATHLGISRTSLWNKLRGDTQFTVADLEALAELLDVPITTFLSGSADAA